MLNVDSSFVDWRSNSATCNVNPFCNVQRHLKCWQCKSILQHQNITSYTNPLTCSRFDDFYLLFISKEEFIVSNVSFAKLLPWKPRRYGCPRMRESIPSAFIVTDTYYKLLEPLWKTSRFLNDENHKFNVYKRYIFRLHIENSLSIETRVTFTCASPRLKSNFNHSWRGYFQAPMED